MLNTLMNDTDQLNILALFLFYKWIKCSFDTIEPLYKLFYNSEQIELVKDFTVSSMVYEFVRKCPINEKHNHLRLDVD
jgi:hypothetical protein